MNLRTFDISPLYRTSVGFDRLAQVMDGLGRGDTSSPSYPPYNIEKTGEASYRISLAVAGFSEDEIEIETSNGQLKVSGSHKETQEKGNGRSFLYRGIAERAFDRRFELDAHVKATGANLENGLLHVDLEREIPEELKPRRIEVGNGKAALQA